MLISATRPPTFLLVAAIQVVMVSAMKLQTNYHTFTNEFGSHTMRGQKISPPTLSETDAPPIVCIHGFGGNADQFRKNLPAFAADGYDSHAVDLLGYGYSDKPNPKNHEPNTIYNFENWSEQIMHYVENTVQRPSVLVCNSVGGVVGLQAAKSRPDLVKGLVLSNMSLRLLHTKKQNPLQRPFTSLLQTVLRETSIGKQFFNQVATPKALRNILSVAYGYQGTDQLVDEETVDVILKPGLTPGAVDVFLDFISYSGGPLPEELLPEVECPVSLVWGENDPWEPMELGRETFANFPCVKEFVPLPGGGHCPMDQIPDAFNDAVLRFMREHSEVLV